MDRLSKIEASFARVNTSAWRFFCSWLKLKSQYYKYVPRYAAIDLSGKQTHPNGSGGSLPGSPPDTSPSDREVTPLTERGLSGSGSVSEEA